MSGWCFYRERIWRTEKVLNQSQIINIACFTKIEQDKSSFKINMLTNEELIWA